MNEPLSQNDRVQLKSSTDPDAVPEGTKGIVQNSGVCVEGQMIWGVRWDNGSTLNLIEGEDEWYLL